MPIPAQGLLRIYPQTVSIISGNYSVAGNGVGAASPLASLAQLQAYYDLRTDTPANAPRGRFINETPALGGTWVPAAGVYELQFSTNTSRVLFDPAGVADEIDFLSADFPMGLTLDALRVHWNGGYTTGPARDVQLTDLRLKYFGATVKQVTPTPGIAFDGDIESGIFDIIPFLSNWSFLNALKVFGWSITNSSVVSAVLSQPALRNDLIYLEATYNTLFFNTSLETPNGIPGDIVIINGNNLNILDEFYIYWNGDGSDIDGLAGGIRIPEGFIYEHTSTRLKFMIPTYLGIPYGGKRLMVTGKKSTGTTFVGQIPIANLNILLVDGSGVYQLTTGKRNDTYYDRGTTPVETVDIKIPDPYGRTGYF